MHLPEEYIKNLLLDKRIENILIAASKAATGIDQFYIKMEQSSRVQTIHEDDHDLWFHRDELMIAFDQLKTNVY